MKNYKKTFLGSIIVFFVGTSCCWLSTLAIWIGGVAFLGTIGSLIKNVQFYIISLAIILLIVSITHYINRRNKSS
ncbi:MAG: hypothetical protein V3V14_09480 [Saprospiraceae bacterium]